MSYAEDEGHDLDPEFMDLVPFGSDYDLDTAKIEQNSYYAILLGYKGHCEVLIDQPFETQEAAIQAAKQFKNHCSKAKICKGKPAGFGAEITEQE